MTLRLDAEVKDRSPLNEWPLPLSQSFVGSTPLLWLTRDLKLYTEGRVLGRSYLIAGHRGAGKTALVARAVDMVRVEVMRRSVKAEGTSLREGPFQRPLLVKLYGPSMLAPETAEPESPQAEPEPAADQGQSKSESGKSEAPAQGPAKPVPPAKGVHAALVQIAIGLYRALAAEAATGYRAYARLSDGVGAADAAELAAQLALDLDTGVEAASLRSYWSRLRRLKLGVFWPRDADDSLCGHRMEDQGFREVVAIATAAQAFQVCSGRVSYATTVKDNVVRSETSETKGSSDIKAILERLGPLGIGAVAGIAALPQATAGVALGAGLITWFLGSLTVTWSRSRTRKDDRTLDYSFIRDRDRATLDRDLPLVISRLREAGLAPVFVIDELDKVENAADELVKLIGRLKHLIADFGFFCFLVNRDCYEEFERRIAARTYPPEHTLFSERILLRPEPDFLLRHLLALVKGDEGLPNQGVARAVFALATMHETRLNLTEVIRVVSRVVRSDETGTEEPIGTIEDILKQRRRVLATVQIAIGQVLEEPFLADRIAVNPGFAQLAIDTLYYPSDQWSRGEAVVDPSRERLHAHLLRRLGYPPEGHGQADGELELPGVSGPDFYLLHRSLIKFLNSLADLEGLRTSLAEQEVTGDVKLKDVLPIEVPKIVEREKQGTYRFLFNSDGEPIVEDAGVVTRETGARLRELLEYSMELRKVVSGCRTTFDELAETPLLSGISNQSLEVAHGAVSMTLRLGSADPEALQHAATLERLVKEVQLNPEKLAYLLFLTASVSRSLASPEAAGPPVALPAFRRLIPYRESPAKWLTDSLRGLPPLPSDTAQLQPWLDDLLNRPLPAKSAREPQEGPFAGLLPHFRRFFADGSAPVRFSYSDLVRAAEGKLPEAVLSTDLNDLTVADWSALALAAIPVRGAAAEAPYWLLPAALRALGFGREALVELADPALESTLRPLGWLMGEATQPGTSALAIAEEIAKGAPERPTGVLVIDTDEERYGRAKPLPARPALVVHANELADYAQALNWLRALDILSLASDARPDGPGVEE
ncbi:MAG TPA: hypothetical protein VF605_00525 [Allosphingosinicella sp.]|jgi:hypothetical protein